MNKKIIAFIIALAMLFSVSGCKSNRGDGTDADTNVGKNNDDAHQKL